MNVGEVGEEFVYRLLHIRIEMDGITMCTSGFALRYFGALQMFRLCSKTLSSVTRHQDDAESVERMDAAVPVLYSAKEGNRRSTAVHQ